MTYYAFASHYQVYALAYFPNSMQRSHFIIISALIMAADVIWDRDSFIE